MKNDKTIRAYVSCGGTKVYKLPIEAFPNHVTNCYLVMDDAVTLVDTGSGWQQNNEELLRAFGTLRDDFGEQVALADVGRLLISHGHIDHFGGLNFVLEHSKAKLGIHRLDAPVVRHFRERLIFVTKNLQLFLDRAGIGKKRIETILEMNKWSKDLFQAVAPDFTFTEGAMPDSPFHMYHVPGHCPGQVCIRIDDILLTADHVLSHITPSQSPESIAHWTGLGHYLDSLEHIRELSGISVALGGHEDEVRNLAERIGAIIEFHERRLDKVLHLCDEPKSIRQISQELFGEQVHYHVLLALLETGAHVEYLYERGQLVTANIEEVEHEYNPVLLYQRV